MPISVTILLSVVYFYSPTTALTVTYSEIQQLGGSCYPRDSCSGGRSEKLDNLWNNYTCECGRHCTIRSTCCIDSPFVTEVQDTAYPSVEKCQKIKLVSRPVWMVSECSKHWRNSPPIDAKCEVDEDVLNDPMAKAPVTSISTSTSYKNYFCAFCNFDSDNVVFWSIAFIGRQSQNILLENLVFNAEQNTWGTVEQGTFRKLKLRFSVPEFVHELVKPCYPGMISQCPSSRIIHDLQRKCWLYYAPIRVLSEGKLQMYRNIHCAVCSINSLGGRSQNTRPSLSKLTPWLILGDPFSADMTVKETELDAACPLPIRSKTHPLSFVTMFDVNLQDGEKVGKARQCGATEMYDPFFKMCRSMRCVVPGYVIKNGSCAKS